MFARKENEEEAERKPSEEASVLSRRAREASPSSSRGDGRSPSVAAGNTEARQVDNNKARRVLARSARPPPEEEEVEDDEPKQKGESFMILSYNQLTRGQRGGTRIAQGLEPIRMRMLCFLQFRSVDLCVHHDC